MFPSKSILDLILAQTGHIDDSIGIVFKFKIAVVFRSNQTYYRRASPTDCECHYRMPKYILSDNGLKKNVYWEKLNDKTRVTFSDLIIATNEDLISLCMDIESHMNHMSSHWTNIYKESSIYLSSKSKLMPKLISKLPVRPFVVELVDTNIDINAQISSIIYTKPELYLTLV